ITGLDVIKPENYFTENEINNAKKFEPDNLVETIKLPYTIPNVLRADNDDFVTIIKMTELVKLHHSNIIFYDYETQRSPKFKRSKSGIVMAPDVNEKSVEDIAESMLNETYLMDMMTINCFSEEKEV